ncbi:MAG: GFA family protein [Betaproteobacteria bacterium]|nr:MAG: GFA family protein [Betaproteobacteria bacterium]
MARNSNPARASCVCGAVQITMHGRALSRFYCHCSICQRLNKAPFGDPVFVWRWNVHVEDPTQLTWKRYRWLPINLNRGTCQTCGTLILEHLAATPMSVVIGRAWEDPQLLPPAWGHIFYESRVADVDDGLPKRSGYMSSELAAFGWNLAGMFGRS